MSEFTNPTTFDDELHQLMNFPRPKTEEDTEKLMRLLTQLHQTCSSSSSSSSSRADQASAAAERWKRLVLSLIHKRHHILSPEAQAIVRREGGHHDDSGGGDDDDDDDDGKTSAHDDIFASSAGDGERKIFYRAIQSLLQDALVDTNKNSKDDKVKAFEALLRVAPWAGGSRDVCTILEDSLSVLLEHNAAAATTKVVAVLSKQETEEKSMAYRVGKSIRFLTEQFQHNRGDNSSVYKHLEDLLQLAADTLDKDLDIVRAGPSQDNDVAAGTRQYKKFPSTLHVFIPHRDRGRVSSSKKKRKTNKNGVAGEVPLRQVVNATAEILIWSRTNAAMSQSPFARSYEEFLGEEEEEEGKKNAKKNALHTMQTIIRKLRKELNDYARSHGFMLTDQFNIDPSAVTLKKVNMGKSADLALLTATAKKKGSAHVLKLIHSRFASNPARITTFASIKQICTGWASFMYCNQNDEIDVLERDIQVSRLKATLTYLRKVLNQKGWNMKKEDEENDTKLPRAVVASMDHGIPNDITAILVAAAMGSWEIEEEEATDFPSKDSIETVLATATAADVVATSSKEANNVEPKLFVGGRERSLSSIQDCIQLLDQTMQGSEKNETDAPSFMDDYGVSTTKAVVNMIDRHVADGETLLLITSADIRLPEDVMKGLIARGCSLHCHDADDIGERLQREEASKGDITISLAWDTIDDLDLHVTVPGGERVCFWKRLSNDGNCMLDVDMNAHPPRSAEPVENVFCGNLNTRTEAPYGHYTVEVQNYNYHTEDQTAAIPFRVVVEKNNEKERFTGECKGTDEASNVVVCEFVYKGRTAPFPSDVAYTAAFATSNLVNVTSSTGQNLESLANLVQILKQHKHLDDARKLNDVDLDEDSDAVTEDFDPLVAPHGTLEITSRERHDILLAKLPKKFHVIVGDVFGGPTLAQECAKGIARRMMTEMIPLSELIRKGFPSMIIEAVRQALPSSGAADMS